VRVENHDVSALGPHSLNGLTDSLRRAGTIEWVHMRHEEAGAFAAGAEAHLTGKLAVCAGSCGPGNLHLINGLFDCYRSRVPVLAIAAHIPSEEIGSLYFQATHPENLFAECSHYVELVSNIEHLPRILEKAIRVAVAQRGVAVVVIPGDIALKTPGVESVPAFRPSLQTGSIPAIAAVGFLFGDRSEQRIPALWSGPRYESQRDSHSTRAPTDRTTEVAGGSRC